MGMGVTIISRLISIERLDHDIHGIVKNMLSKSVFFHKKSNKVAVKKLVKLV